MEITEEDLAAPYNGLELQLDFGLYEDEVETRQRAKNLKKKGNKPLGGKLIKMT